MEKLGKFVGGLAAILVGATGCVAAQCKVDAYDSLSSMYSRAAAAQARFDIFKSEAEQCAPFKEHTIVSVLDKEKVVAEYSCKDFRPEGAQRYYGASCRPTVETWYRDGKVYKKKVYDPATGATIKMQMFVDGRAVDMD